jgi:hypothetical protein
MGLAGYCLKHSKTLGGDAQAALSEAFSRCGGHGPTLLRLEAIKE